ncbi:MAG: HEPN domain-containing protein [Victivallaceae bacterium]|nr:HEPN domain-containing protein [Victivallaceae bacterium]
MKKSIEHLPAEKRRRLENAVEAIRQMCDDVEMIILFGSHARGDYRDEEDLKPDRKSGAPSDFDIMVVCKDKDLALNYGFWNKVSERCNGLDPDMPFRLIVHDIAYVKIRLKQIHYFFSDIVREGCLLYDSGRYRLKISKELSHEQKLEVATEHFEHWFESAEIFYEKHDIGKETRRKYLNNAAFQLHQAAESSYKALALVFTNYCTHNHFLELADRQAQEILPEMEDIFPRISKADEDRFKNFDYAYIGARYDPKYEISRKDLEYFAGRVKLLLELTEKLCKEKIESLRT